MSSIANNTNEKSQLARAALLQAAEALFTAKGYAQVSTREIADAAGVNLAAIQYYFGSKSKLFVETARHIMQKSTCVKSYMAQEINITDQHDAARAICEFIAGHLHYLLRPSGPRACQLIFREILTDDEENREMYQSLVTLVSEEFGKPLENKLTEIIKHIQPTASRSQLASSARSILGQCSLYVTHRAFLEHRDGRCFADSPQFEETAKHIMTFSLRGLGCDEQLITEVLNSVKIDPQVSLTVAPEGTRLCV